MIQWQTAPYSKAGDAQIADAPNGSRLYVKRAGKGLRAFYGYINGERVGTWDTLDMAKSQTAKAFNRFVKPDASRSAATPETHLGKSR